MHSKMTTNPQLSTTGPKTKQKQKQSILTSYSVLLKVLHGNEFKYATPFG